MEEIIKELKSIKKFLAIGAISVLIIAVSSVLQSYNTISTCSSRKTIGGYAGFKGREFQNRANEMLISGRYSELIHLAETRKMTHPNDAYIYYYLGRTYQNMGDHQKAIENFEKAKTIAPVWDEEWLSPLLEKSREALNKP